MILKFIENDGVTGARLTMGERPIPDGSFLYRDGRYIRGGELGTIPAFATHRHAGDTLKHVGVNSASTAFSFATAGPVTFSQLVNAASGSTFGNLTLADGSITDSSGDISFGDENLTTTGTIQSAAIGCGIAPSVAILGNFYRNDASTDPMIKIEQDGTGDASLSFGLTGGQFYAIGIDNSETGDILKISPGSTLVNADYFTMNADGQVGFGSIPNPDTQTYVIATPANKPYQGILGTMTTSTSVTGDYNHYGMYFTVNEYVNVGFRNRRVAIGCYVQGKSYVAGTLDELYGMNITYDMRGTGTTTIAAGLQIKQFAKTGTTGSAYDVLIAAPSTGGTVTNDWCIYSDHAAPSRLIDDLQIADDDKSILIGVAQDFGISYNGTEGYIDTGLIAPSDLLIDCGTEKTIELVESVWEDLQFQITAGKQPASSAPTWATLTTNTGEYGFDVNDYIDLASNELDHGWKEGTTGNFHLHISIPDANATGSSRYAQFTIYVAYVNASSIWTETSLTAEREIQDGSSALENFFLDMGDVSFAGLDIGTQVKVNVKRIAATGGTEYGSNVFIHQVGCHLEYDTIGSRQETIK